MLIIQANFLKSLVLQKIIGVWGLLTFRKRNPSINRIERYLRRAALVDWQVQ